MSRPLFTPEELAELAAFDAEIDAEPEWDPEEIKAARERDRQARLERKDNRGRKIAEAQREYYAANREKIAEAKREYRAANREKGWTPLKAWRKLHGYTQRELAELFHVSQGTISNWENGIGCPWAKGEMTNAV